MKEQRVFLDYASATPLSKKVFKKMKPFLGQKFANPSALYQEATKVRQAIETARQEIARICRVKNHEVIFTSGGTESINLALLGIFKAATKNGATKSGELITSPIEHPAVIESTNEISRLGHNINFLKVNEKGQINLQDFRANLNENTLLVSVMLVNNEIGNINPIKKISSEIKKFKNQIGRNFNEPPFLHTDASQAPNFLEIDFDKLGVDMMTLDGSKIYGPKGIGCLIKKDHVPLEKINFGGGQEFGLRAGTENVPAIIGMAEALKNAQKERENFFNKMRNLQKYFLAKIDTEIKPIGASKKIEIKINGDLENRAPNNINICFSDLQAEFAVIQLDNYGIVCSSVTACKSINSDSRSYVIDALDQNCGANSLRFSFGWGNTKRDIDRTIKALKKVI